ncbi:MAG: amidophosphoribosyltransferase [Planctomycetota bacterium]|nr:MAG: amidophosphoribosyltransferase [Planctomycetota bacterium]
MSELFHECGVAAVYYLPGRGKSALLGDQSPDATARFIPRMLLDIQNRGQLSAGLTSYNPRRNQLLDTYKELGGVGEVFRLSHRGKYESLMRKYAGRAAIGQVRYATCGAEDRSYAQPFERHHVQKHKWFSFAFNGQLANYQQLRQNLLADTDNYLARDTDTEIIMHEIGRELSENNRPSLIDIMRSISGRFDGAYCLVLLNALGDMLVARDPLGLRPLCYAIDGPLFAAASESVALVNLGFAPENIKSLLPGQAITITDGELEIQTFARSTRRAHCFFEWIYFANVASTMDGRSVYLSRTALGHELARLETVPIDDDTIVVPVPDTSKAAADAMAFKLGIPSFEGLIRNRYTGRTFIEGSGNRMRKAETKYTPLGEVLEGKRVLLVEDSIVRSTTMKVLLKRIRKLGKAREIHVRVACPPIVAPCFYGIDMSTISELFAPQFLHGGPLTDEAQVEMARALGADSLRYLPVESIARAIGFDADQLCQACITGEYPSTAGQQLYKIALANDQNGSKARTYESPVAIGAGDPPVRPGEDA